MISIIPLIRLRIEIEATVIKVGDRPPLLLIFVVEVPSHDALSATAASHAGLVANCTSKMLLGHPCLGPPRPGLDADRAAAVVRAAGFVGLTERFADSLLLLKRTFDFDARAPRMPPGSTLERRAGLRQSAYTPEDLKEGLAELKHWRTPDHDVYDVAAQLFDERFRRSGEEILDLVLSLPSRRRLAQGS